MKIEPKVVPDPRSGVAGSAVATSMGQPGGRILTAEDIPELLRGGRSLEEVIALQLAPPDAVEAIAEQLVENGTVPPERFSFER